MLAACSPLKTDQNALLVHLDTPKIERENCILLNFFELVTGLPLNDIIPGKLVKDRPGIMSLKNKVYPDVSSLMAHGYLW